MEKTKNYLHNFYKSLRRNLSERFHLFLLHRRIDRSLEHLERIDVVFSRTLLHKKAIPLANGER